MIPLATAQFLFSLLVLLYAKRCLKSGLPSLLAVHVAAIIILDSLGVAMAPFLPVENLAYIGNPNIVPLIRSITPALYFQQCMSHWIFLGIAFAALRWEMSWSRPRMDSLKPVRSSMFWGYTVFIVGVMLSIKYYFVGPGWTVLRETRLIFISTSEAVTHRVMGYLAAGIGEGNYMASVAAYVFFPLAAALISLKQKRINWALFSSAGLFSLLYAYQTRQKAPLLWASLTFIFLYYLSAKEKRHNNILKGMVLATMVVGTLGTILLYMVNFGQTLLSSVQGFFFRAFLVPASSETNFFVIFSESLPFRGISHVLSMPWGRVSTTDMVSILDVARVATGTAYSANASFLAVAWSAAGYFGIVLVSLILVASLVALDRSYCLVPKKLFYIALALSPVHLITLISDGFTTYVGRGGLVVPLLIILLTKAPAISFKSKRPWK